MSSCVCRVVLSLFLPMALFLKINILLTHVCQAGSGLTCALLIVSTCPLFIFLKYICWLFGVQKASSMLPWS